MSRTRRLTALSQLLAGRSSPARRSWRALAREGLSVTQATLSRDLRSLGRGEAAGRRRPPGLRAAAPGGRDPRPRAPAARSARFVNEVRVAQNLVVVRTPPGHANGVGARDRPRGRSTGLVGSVAGDDTVLVVLASAGTRARSSISSKRHLDGLAAGTAKPRQVSRAMSTTLSPNAAPASGPRRRRRTRGARVAVLGASGYSGQEFARLPLAHPGSSSWRCARASTRGGLERAAARRSIRARTSAAGPARIEPDALAESRRSRRRATRSSPACRTARGRACSPSAPRARGGGLRIVDLSSDHRDGIDGYVYGLPEAFRERARRRHAHRQPGLLPDGGDARAAAGARAGLARRARSWSPRSRA